MELVEEDNVEPSTATNCRKRKLSSDSPDDILHVFKRVNVSMSPGEIRLKNDMNECADLHPGVLRFEHNDCHPHRVVVYYRKVCFHIKVGKYYPHTRPEVSVVPEGTELGRVLVQAVLQSPAIRNWTPVCTMRSVLLGIKQVVEDLRITGE